MKQQTYGEWMRSNPPMQQQTAVEWLIEQVNGYSYPLPYNENIRIDIPKEVIEQAKEMEKEQMKKAYNADFHLYMERDFEQYYNETFKNK